MITHIYTAMDSCYANHVQGLAVLLVLAAMACYAISAAFRHYGLLFILTCTFTILNVNFGPAGM